MQDRAIIHTNLRYLGLYVVFLGVEQNGQSIKRLSYGLEFSSSALSRLQLAREEDGPAKIDISSPQPPFGGCTTS